VLCPVKHVHLAANRLGSDQVGLLGHVSCPVDLAFVSDGLFDADFSGCLLIRA
jgi:hypothetical protein